MNTELERLTTDLATRAAGLTVTDQATANQATELILAGKDMIKKIKVFFTPLKDAARVSWQGLVDKEKIELARVEPIVDALNNSIASWRAVEQRKWDAAEAERLRIEREKKRLEEDVLRKAREAEEKAERERRRLEEEAERLNKEAAKKTNDEAALKHIDEEREKIRLQAEENRKIAEEETTLAIDEAAKAEAAMAPAPIVPEAPKTAGLAMRDNWCFEVVDPAAVPREYLIINEVAIGKIVRALRGKIEIPGIRVFNRPIMASIGRRTGNEIESL
jgi:DNA repair exonuclease SbcCD ATPase subunit